MTTSKTALEELLVRVGNGEKAAFSELYQQTSPLFYGIALKIMKTPEYAQDALQDAYVKIWHSATEYHREKGTAKTWMGSIVRYRCFDLLKKINRNESMFDHREYILVEDDNPGPLYQALIDSDAKALMDCIEELQEMQKTSILMAFYEGLTYQQLSHYFSVPLGTVKSWIRRSLIVIKECLG